MFSRDMKNLEEFGGTTSLEIVNSIYWKVSFDQDLLSDYSGNFQILGFLLALEWTVIF